MQPLYKYIHPAGGELVVVVVVVVLLWVVVQFVVLTDGVAVVLVEKKRVNRDGPKHVESPANPSQALVQTRPD